GLGEMGRVARRVVVFTFDTSDPSQFWLTRDYLPEVGALRACKVLASLTELAHAIGARMEPVPIPWDCADGFFEAYWRRPEAYLHEEVRRGISVWDAVGPAVEQRAVQSLRADLASGRWAERNHDVAGLDAAELGARLLIASAPEGVPSDASGYAPWRWTEGGVVGREQSGHLARPTPSSLADVVEIVLSKGVVIDAYARVSVVGIELLTVDTRIVMSSV